MEEKATIVQSILIAVLSEHNLYNNTNDFKAEIKENVPTAVVNEHSVITTILNVESKSKVKSLRFLHGSEEKCHATLTV